MPELIAVQYDPVVLQSGKCNLVRSSKIVPVQADPEREADGVGDQRQE